jgi:molybdopterin synthase sulfur carrier subunit
VNIEVRLFAQLRKYLPHGSSQGSTRIDMPDGATIADALAELGIPASAAHLTLVDGSHEANLGRQLKDGCTLSVFPPMAGGQRLPVNKVPRRPRAARV